MWDAIIACGRGFKGPSMHDLRGSLLHKEVTSIEEYLTDFKVSWTKIGCTIMSDGWSDGRNRNIINFLVSCPQGTMFLRSVDASDRVKDAKLLFELLDEVVMEVGVANIIQVITDNASNYVLARKMLEEKHKTIFWTLLSPSLGITKEITSRGPRVLDMEYREPNDLSMAPEGPLFFSAVHSSLAAVSIPPTWS
jgi:hypothetical protein